MSTECKQFSKCFSYRQIWSHFELCFNSCSTQFVSCLSQSLSSYLRDWPRQFTPVSDCFAKHLPNSCRAFNSCKHTHTHLSLPLQIFCCLIGFQSFGKNSILSASFRPFCQLPFFCCKCKVAHWPRVSHRSSVLPGRQHFTPFLLDPCTWRLTFFLYVS